MSNIDKQGRQVQRYKNFGVDMMERDEGGYVKHSDYLALLDELEAAEKRIAGLEARTVKLPPTLWYEHDDLPREIPVLSRRLVINALREAGINIAAAPQPSNNY